MTGPEGTSAGSTQPGATPGPEPAGVAGRERGGASRPERAATTGPDVHPIEAASYAIMAERVDLSRWPVGARQVVGRMIHATADESFGATARIGDQAVGAGVAALRAAAPVVCDSAMVAAGASAAARFSNLHCYLDQVAVAPAGSTRAAAAMTLAVAAHPEDAVWIVGNAPTALAALLDLWQAGRVRPAVVIGLPVGYVGAAEAKAALWDSSLRDLTITNVGPRGGSAVAAAAINALARLASASGPAPTPDPTAASS
jgi:precorrin-8X/cobalt-precorrin-8 methylmutase